MSHKTTEFTSPISGNVYNVYDVAPTILRLIVTDGSESEQSIALLNEIEQLSQSIKTDQAWLKDNLSETEKKQVTDRIAEYEAKIRGLSIRLHLLTKIKPETICKILRTFV